MRISLTAIFFILSIAGALGQVMEEAKWNYFYTAAAAEDVAETQTDIWFAVEDYLLRIDKQTSVIQRVNAPFEDDTPLEQLWIDTEGQMHLLVENNIGFPEGEEAWAIERVNSNGLYLVDRLIHRKADGEFLFLGAGAAKLFYWRPNESPRTAYDLLNVLPWRLERIVRDENRQGYWASKGNELVFFKDGMFTYADVPAELEDILQLHLDKNGDLWVRTHRQLAKYTGTDWLVDTPMEAGSTGTFKFATLSNGSALVVSNEDRVLLTPTTSGFQVTDFSEDLASVSPNSTFLFDETDRLWWIDAKTGTAKHWRAGEDVVSKRPALWLPFAGTVEQLTSDAAGRIWVSGDYNTYYYANHQWWKGETLYPGFPDSTRQIAFNTQCEPVVLRSPDPGFLNIGAKLFLYQPTGWILLPDDRIVQPSLSNAIAKIRFDRNDHLLMQRFFGNNYQIWAYGEWTSILSLDYFPLAGRLYDIAVGEDNRVYILTDIGLFVRTGATYDYYPADNFTDISNSILQGRLQYSSSETLWVAYNKQLSRWQNDELRLVMSVPDTMFSIPDINAYDIFIELYVFSDKDIWLTSTFGVYHYDGEAMVHYYELNSGLPFDRANHLAKDDRQRIWMNGGNIVAVMELPSAAAPSLSQAGTATDDFYLFPNPACCQTQATWEQASNSTTTLRLYNTQGQLLRTVVDAELPVGRRTVTVPRNALPTGTYYLVLDQAGIRKTRQFVWK